MRLQLPCQRCVDRPRLGILDYQVRPVALSERRQAARHQDGISRSICGLARELPGQPGQFGIAVPLTCLVQVAGHARIAVRNDDSSTGCDKVAVHLNHGFGRVDERFRRPEARTQRYPSADEFSPHPPVHYCDHFAAKRITDDQLC